MRLLHGTAAALRRSALLEAPPGTAQRPSSTSPSFRTSHNLRQQNRRRQLPTMSSQPAHPTLLIPGPVEFDDGVLQSMSHYSESHVGAGFVATFGETLSMLRQLFQTTDAASQPFVLSGSGTLPKLLQRGIIFAGGLHKEIGPKYVRFGHMGVTVVDAKRNDIDRALEALQAALAECGYNNA